MSDVRVLQLVTQARGGPVDHAVGISSELVRLGHASHLVGPRGDQLATAAAAGVRTHVAEIRGKADVTGYRAVADLIARLRPDVVHLQDRRAGLVGRVLAAGCGMPSVYTLHGAPDELASLVPGNLAAGPARVGDRFRYLVLERMLATVPRSVVVAPCEALAAYARDQVGVRRDRVRMVPNGVGPRWFSDRAPAPRPGRAPVRVTWLGVMQPVKRVPDLVRAVARVTDVELELVGDGPERPRIEAVVAGLGVDDRVRFAGHQADPAPYLRRADVFVLPSAAEACPLALLQAMASGVPVIASRVGGVPEIVRPGVDGLLVAPGDVAGLAAALATLVGDAGLRARLGAAGRARVADRFEVRGSARSLVAIYEELTG